MTRHENGSQEMRRSQGYGRGKAARTLPLRRAHIAKRLLLRASALAIASCTAVQGVTRYVWTGSPTPGTPFTSWATAAHTIQEAVDAAAQGDTVLVTNGVYQTGGLVTPEYSLSNRVVITKNILVRSVNGAAVTTIKGKGPPGNAAVRCVLIDSGVLDGFTLTNGFTNIGSQSSYDQSGGGAHASGGTLRNCLLTGNSAHNGGGAYMGTLINCRLMLNWAEENGGGAKDSTLNNCTLDGNSAQNNGGGAHESILDDCVVTGNSADKGGGAYSCLLANCVLTNNTAHQDGGGAKFSTLGYCTLTGNSANTGGGGASSCTLNGCTLNLNSTRGSGGGAGFGTLNNCLLVDNSATWGGGVCGGMVNNCTIISNSANTAGGGMYLGAANNSILYYNAGTNCDSVSLEYCCTTPDVGGVGNITNEPGFVSANDYHLPVGSPCIDAGEDLPDVAFDLDAVPRPLDGDNDGEGRWDIGCYEYVSSVADSDGDGSSDGSEMVADTDPLDAASVLRFLAIAEQWGGTRLDWEGGSAAVQFLETSTDLRATNWTVIYALPPPTPLTNAVIHFGATNRVLFYRIRVAR